MDYHLFTEIKRELRNNQLPQLLKQKSIYNPLIVVADYISPDLKEGLSLQITATFRTPVQLSRTIGNYSCADLENFNYSLIT